MRPIPREVPAHAREATARIVESWGYWRKIDPIETACGYWVEDELGRGVIWFVDAPEAGSICLHGIGSPGSRLRTWIFSPEVVEIVRVIACLLGAKRLYAPIPADARALSRYLRLRGWRPAESVLGPYLELGG